MSDRAAMFERFENQQIEIERLRSLLQDVVDDMMFNTAPNAGTMDKIREALSRAPDQAMPGGTPYDQRREALARVLAASLMGLVKDTAGAKLPEDCWRQMTTKADAILFIVSPPSSGEHEQAGKALERHISAA
jgi:hypothetical protein